MVTIKPNIPQAVRDFLRFAHDVVTPGAPLDTSRAVEYAELLKDPRFLAALEVAHEYEGERQPSPAVSDSKIRISMPKWEKFVVVTTKKRDGSEQEQLRKWKAATEKERKTGRKVWLTKVNDFNLRIDFHKTKADGVMFHGASAAMKVSLPAICARRMP